MKKLLACALLALASVSAWAQAQFTPGQILTAAQLNAQFALYASLGGAVFTGPVTIPTLTVTGTASIGTLQTPNAAITGGSISGISPLPIGSGGTGQATASAAAHALNLGTTDTPTFYGVIANGSTAHGVAIAGGNGNPFTWTSPGTTGQVFASNGASADPSFQSTTSLGLLTNVASVNSTTQTASIATTTAYAIPSGGAGLYLIIVDMVCTTAGTAGTVTATAGWNNGAASASAATGAMPLTTAGNEVTQSITVYSAGSQNITYSTTVSGATGSPQYAIRFRVIYLG